MNRKMIEAIEALNFCNWFIKEWTTPKDTNRNMRERAIIQSDKVLKVIENKLKKERLKNDSS